MSRPFRPESGEGGRMERGPAFAEIREILRVKNLAEHFLPEAAGAQFDFCKNPLLIAAVENELGADVERLNAALADMGEEIKVTETDMESLESLGSKLVILSMSVMRKQSRERPNKKEDEAAAEKIIEKIAEEKGAPWFPEIVSEAEITGKPEEKEMPAESAALPENLKDKAQKKIMVDTYSVGSSLNDLGGFWAYHSELPWKETSASRAMSAALRLANNVTAFIMTKRGLKIETMGAGQVKRLGHLKMSFEEEENGEVNASLKIEGQTPSELAHEASKGLLEYVFSDTSLPAENEISKKDAQMLKNYLERPSVEIFEGIYGPALAKKVDGTVNELVQNEKILQLIEANENLPEKTAKLRVLKLISMLDTGNLSKFYESAVEGEIPEDLLQKLQKAKNLYLGH